MGIPFSVAAVLARSALEEDNYAQVDDPGCSASSNGPICKAPLISPPRSRPSRAPRSSLSCATERRSISASTMSRRHARRNPRFRQAASSVVGDRARDLEELVDNCTSLPDSRVIAARCRLEPTEQRLRPAS